MIPTDPISALLQGGAVAALVFVTYGFLSGKVVPRIWYDAQTKFYESALAAEKEMRAKAEKDAEWFRNLTEHNASLAEKSLDIERRPRS